MHISLIIMMITSNINLSIRKILEEFQDKIKEIYAEELSQLILFGSQARGDAQPDSDINILIVLRTDKKDINKYQKVIELISDLCLKYELLISCVYLNQKHFEQEKSPLLLNIHKEGIIL